MSQQTVIKCDYCGVVKKEKNGCGWMQLQDCQTYLTVFKAGPNIKDLKDACSVSCVQTAVEEFLNWSKKEVGCTDTY